MAVKKKSKQRPTKSQSDEPAKGGIKRPHKRAYASGDSSKAAGDKLQHAVDEATKRKRSR